MYEQHESIHLMVFSIFQTHLKNRYPHGYVEDFEAAYEPCYRGHRLRCPNQQWSSSIFRDGTMLQCYERWILMVNQQSFLRKIGLSNQGNASLFQSFQ